MKIIKLPAKLMFILILFVFSNTYGISQIAENAQNHIKYLASDELEGRFPGTPGISKARDYIVEQFKQLGLKPINGSYTQPLNLSVGYQLGQNNQVYFNVIVPKPGVPIEKVRPMKKTWEVVKDWLPLAFSEEKEVEGEMVFCGYGISAKDLNYDDYASVDVKDKVAVILTNSPDGEKEDGKFANFTSYYYKAKNAKEHGAVAVVFIKIQGDSANVFMPLEKDRFNKNSGIVAIQVNRNRIAEYFPKSSLYPSEIEINKTLKPKSFILPNSKIHIKVDLEDKMVAAENVWGMIEGTDPKLKNEYILVGAHYDHLGWGGPTSTYRGKTPMIHNGADDNASGVAGVIELARYYSPNPQKRSIVFTSFTGEELGLLGSNYMADNPPVDLSKVSLMVNMDMIGRLKEQNLMAIGVASGKELEEIITRLDAEDSLNIIKSNSPIGSSDQTSFYLKNVPSIMFFTGIHPDYHKPSDDWDKINYKSMEDVLIFIEKLINIVAEMPNKLTYIKTETDSPTSHSKTRGMGNIRFGIIPDYASDVKGLKIEGSSPNTPAEKAGLIDGDIIIGIDDKEINNIQDFMMVLREQQPGNTVNVKFIRNGKEMQVKVLLEAKN